MLPIWRKKAYNRHIKKTENQMLKLQKQGYKVERISEWVWKIGDTEVFVGSKKYKLPGKKIAKYQNLEDILK